MSLLHFGIPEQPTPLQEFGAPLGRVALARILFLRAPTNHSLQEQQMASDMRLTQAQKRDLLRMSGAAVVSTIFFAVPMFLGRPDVARLQAVASETQPAPAAAEPAAASQLAAAASPNVAVVFSETVAQVTTPKLQELSAPAAPRARTVRQNAMTAKPRAQVASAAGKPLARRLGRLIAGTGRYEVRPFPTVSTSGS
jgi:hypothetical protein